MVEWIGPKVNRRGAGCRSVHDTDTTIVLIHHESKAGGAGGRGIRGGSALLGAVDQALILELPQGSAQTNRRVIKAIGRYDDTPPELVVELTDEGYRTIGTPTEASREEDASKILRALDDQPRSPDTLAERTGLSPTRVTHLLRWLDQAKVRRQGAGKKGDPYTYCLPCPDSFLSGPDPIGPDQNRDGGLTSAEPADLAGVAG
jgi:hypothetical protein